MAQSPRRRSVKVLGEEPHRLTPGTPAADRLRLRKELRTYQEKLTSQNEQLICAQEALEETRDRFIELYDFAPNGYLVLDENGVVRQINLTGASILGKQRQAIEGFPVLAFVVPADRARVLEFIRCCRIDSSQTGTTIDVTICGADESRFVQLLCRARTRPSPQARREFLMAMIDSTDQRRLEHDRDHSVAERLALAGRLISVQEEERRRIARDLHDNLGQQLTGLRLKLDALALTAVLDDAVRSQVAAVQAAADALDRTVDFIASELRPAALDLGLATALDQFVREWSSTFGVPARLHTGDAVEFPLAPAIETHLYRIVQEALNNVHKHAQASQVNVILERDRRGLLLVVEDNGCGLVLNELRRRGLGMLSIRERAAIIGATLEIESPPGKGTAVFVRVPAEKLQQRGEQP